MIHFDLDKVEKEKQNLETQIADGLVFLQNNKNIFDIILLDAPCSATGTFRKHPEVLHLKTIQDVKKQAGLQFEMLNEAIKSVKKDGLVLYCTCSISKIEGEYIIERIRHFKKPFYKLPILSEFNDSNN